MKHRRERRRVGHDEEGRVTSPLVPRSNDALSACWSFTRPRTWKPCRRRCLRTSFLGTRVPSSLQVWFHSLPEYPVRPTGWIGSSRVRRGRKKKQGGDLVVSPHTEL